MEKPENTPEPDVTTPATETPPDTPPTPPPCITRRHYSLWELVRHEDDDVIDPSPADPNSQVLANRRPSAWPD